MASDETMTERDFYTAVRSSADEAWGNRGEEADFSVDGLTGSLFAGLLSLFSRGRD